MHIATHGKCMTVSIYAVHKIIIPMVGVGINLHMNRLVLSSTRYTVVGIET